ncbi:MAG: hypothetical protein IJV74_04690, partial [Clostridia bacterium]|nr:hypothetical protein [Clostridia bacterium]
KYTRSRLPVELVYSESCETKQQAMSREAQIKKLRRQEKLALLGKAGNNSNSSRAMLGVARDFSFCIS